MYKVSVIIPNYNHSEFLRQRIDSVLAQTYQNIEVIILDDCSPDDSREIINEYKYHQKVSEIVFNTANSGSTFKQWQRGIALAKGEYIWIAESDDWCEPTLLATLMDGLRNNPTTGIAFCQSMYYYEPNKVKETTYYPYYENVEGGKDFIKQYMLSSNKIVNASMAVWKKDLFENVDLEFTSFKFCGDWLFWISILSQCDVFISGKVLNYFRNHDKDVSSRFYSTGDYFIENLELYDLLQDRHILTPFMHEHLVKELYVRFLGVKKHLVRSNIYKIKRAFNMQAGLASLSRLYFTLRNQAFLLKRFILAK
ncbi:glycosyltransferase family 2 protein [Mucilaginibacter ginkgonis]|uniref:Glycosyltransferase n=1 Tax=Mucilaginibacter ginkgonis TaxID=2682091 RepID=A0A6I4HWZ6_9SPHI|nr:glycosyltransferase [Mucilaginibacter ginkgonis]QQL51234.1 glycosyltransferase [Mucilaginibacter ginkgonis]